MALRGLSTSSSAAMIDSICRVTVVGAGQMGSGIAQVAAQSGFEVTLVDLTDGILAKAHNSIQANLALIARKKFANDKMAGSQFITGALGKIKTSTNAEEAAIGSDLIIEAIIENLGAKQKLFKILDAAAPHHAIFATNTSSLRLSYMATELQPSRKQRFGGLHFFIPVPLMQLVEVVRVSETADKTYNLLLAFVQRIGKIPIKCKDNNGFVVNRLLVPYMMEALRMAVRGDATYEDIDNAMKYGAGYKIGPFALADYIGLDVLQYVCQTFHNAYPDDPLFQPISLLDKLVSEGKLGRKTGEGFYKHSKL